LNFPYFLFDTGSFLVSRLVCWLVWVFCSELEFSRRKSTNRFHILDYFNSFWFSLFYMTISWLQGLSNWLFTNPFTHVKRNLHIDFSIWLATHVYPVLAQLRSENNTHSLMFTLRAQTHSILPLLKFGLIKSRFLNRFQIFSFNFCLMQAASAWIGIELSAELIKKRGNIDR